MWVLELNVNASRKIVPTSTDIISAQGPMAVPPSQLQSEVYIPAPANFSDQLIKSL